VHKGQTGFVPLAVIQQRRQKIAQVQNVFGKKYIQTQDNIKKDVNETRRSEFTWLTIHDGGYHGMKVQFT
jgi:hypothetical protein